VSVPSERRLRCAAPVGARALRWRAPSFCRRRVLFSAFVRLSHALQGSERRFTAGGAVQGDHFLVFKRRRRDNALETVHKTEVIKNSKEPLWLPIEIPAAKFNLGDMNAAIVIEVLRLDPIGSAFPRGRASRLRSARARCRCGTGTAAATTTSSARFRAPKSPPPPLVLSGHAASLTPY